MHRCTRIALLTFCLCLFSNGLHAQVDTVRNINDSTTEFHMTKSPLKAVLLSAVLPGAGQVYLHQTWKVPIIAGLAGGFLYGALVQNGRYHQESQNVIDYNAKRTAADSIRALQAARHREFYRDDRDKWWIYLGITYIATLLDAYIAANLYDFDVSDPGSTQISPFLNPMDRSWGLGLSIEF